MNPPIKTILKTTKDIYNEYDGVDKPEQIKYFIKDAIETWGIKYVLIVGGLDSLILGIPRDDENQGTKDWEVPVRYNNIHDNPKYPLGNKTAYDPGVLCDHYYADIYKEGGDFDDWDPNEDGIICSWGKDGCVNDTGHEVTYQIDWDPDVSVGRLACRNIFEVRNMVDKIIKYETNAHGQDWFNRVLTISGDGFLDQIDLNITWDTKGLDDGEYTIYAQSTNHDDPPVSGPIDVINITVDKTQPTHITFNHDDHLHISEYPGKPIAEIVSVSEGNVLGYNDTYYNPNEGEAYCNQFLHWGNITYEDEVLYIRGKSYDPKAYGNITDIKVWINNSIGETVFTDYRNDTEMYYEGEWACGQKTLYGRGGALYYTPPGFEKIELWTSNGLFTGAKSFTDSIDEGSGFLFVSGHGSPTIWCNHLAGVPGNRHHSHVTGAHTIDLWTGGPIFPMDTLSNKYKTPVTLVGGCHNSQFNVSLIPTILKWSKLWTYGTAAPECWSWWLTRVPKKGSLATIGNTGLGYGVIGKDCTTFGLDGGICIEFFEQYNNGRVILGDTYIQTQKTYCSQFDMKLQEHGKTISQWVLSGDPSLKIGGYDNVENQVTIDITSNGLNSDGYPNNPILMNAQPQTTPNSYEWSFDTTGDGIYDTFKTEKNVQQTWEKPGVYWVKIKAIYDDHEEISETIVDIESTEFPEQPTKPTGRLNIRANIPYQYKTSATDPQGNDLWYWFMWGDGEWDLVGPVKSGNTAKAIHKYKQKGSYEIKVMAINQFAHWSEWSESLTVTVTKAKTRDITNNPIFYFLQRFFSNNPNFSPILKQLLGL
jgi:hypothetical protein